MGVGKVLNEVKPYLYMVLLMVGFSGMYIVSVASLRRGMSHFVLVVYRNIVGTAVMAPFALLFERYSSSMNHHGHTDHARQRQLCRDSRDVDPLP
jgi:predicted DNA repair protein MutK